jgi:hypothetical protein
MKFLATIAFTRTIRSGRRKDFVFADFEKLAPKICDMNPHSFFCILGVSPSQIKMTQTKLVQHVVLRSTLFTASIYLNPSRDINFFRFFRFSPILTLWTLQTAVTRSFMVRFEKFLQFWNGHDVASRGGASDTRLRSRRV